jgi:hypothetical protein
MPIEALIQDKAQVSAYQDTFGNVEIGVSYLGMTRINRSGIDREENLANCRPKLTILLVSQYQLAAAFVKNEIS